MEYRVHNRILTVLIASLVILSASVTVSHASIWDHLTGTPKKSNIERENYEKIKESCCRNLNTGP